MKLLIVPSSHSVSECLEVGMCRRFEVNRDVDVFEALVAHDARLVGNGALMGVGKQVDHRVIAFAPQVAELLGAHQA